MIALLEMREAYLLEDKSLFIILLDLMIDNKVPTFRQFFLSAKFLPSTTFTGLNVKPKTIFCVQWFMVFHCTFALLWPQQNHIRDLYTVVFLIKYQDINSTYSEAKSSFTKYKYTDFLVEIFFLDKRSKTKSRLKLSRINTGKVAKYYILFESKFVMITKKIAWI